MAAALGRLSAAHRPEPGRIARGGGAQGMTGMSGRALLTFATTLVPVLPAGRLTR